MFGFPNLLSKIRYGGRFSLLILICIFIHFFFFDNRIRFEQSVAKFHVQNKQSNIVSKLYLEYCITRVLDRKKCIFSQPFFKLKNSRKLKDDRLLLKDMGGEYRQTTHFLSFYDILLFKKESLSHLPSYNDYILYKSDIEKKLRKIHEKYQYASYINRTIPSSLRSIIRANNLFSFIVLVFVFLVFIIPLEKIVGTYLIGSLVFLPTLISYFGYTSGSIGSLSTVSISLGIIFSIFGFMNVFSKNARFYYYKKQSLPLFIVIFLLASGIIFVEFNLSRVNFSVAIYTLTFLIGLNIGIIYRALYKLPTGFYSFKIYRHWKDILENNTLHEIVKSGNQILIENPENDSVKKDIVLKLLDAKTRGEGLQTLWNDYNMILAELIPRYIRHKKNYPQTFQLLTLVPDSVSFSDFIDDEMAQEYLEDFIVFVKGQGNANIINKLESLR